MMAYEQRDNSGSLFKNDRKEKENQPDYTGTGMYGGQEIRISAWLKTSKAGKKFLSLSIQPKVEDHQNERPAVRKSSADIGRDMGSAPRDMDDEIPFAPEFR
jgi:uncharacterized protein (DUF736 family)